MGMDVHGKNPRSETGKYSRASVWWWRPLWKYCCAVAPEVIDAELARACHYNDDAGLDDAGAVALAGVLQREIDTGRAQEYEARLASELEAVPDEPCAYCNATGTRTDSVGVQTGFPTRLLPPEVAAEVGRFQGWCNGCGGRGKTRPLRAAYGFSTEVVTKWVA